ncbi:hypothetical protein FJ872_32890 [Mesorhizobium sp. B2-5-9]|uniref:hypothetical protein n=1 Tax=Mesorhizobium sp. B2-5-9 TaxID=2589921 RepID=UPI00112949AD|nr:hypothetical protein [Mesorhizobium sp. B2-5-9]TPJ95614.1 hypothetical protein FJ872_32890 [Mesorhizobium sp. B2-5-9]
MDDKTPLPPLAAGEFCYLQLRMLCELIALSSLLAHGDVPGARSNTLRGAWTADQIIAAMGRLHAHFYPRPFTKREEGGEINFDEMLATEYLTKDELPRLYALCGNILHRGSLGSLFSGKAAKPNRSEVGMWRFKIGNLLSVHLIELFDMHTQYLCDINDYGRGGRIEMAVMNLNRPLRTPS